MTSSRHLLAVSILGALLSVALTGIVVAGALPNNLNVSATLVWGTKEQPKDKGLKRVNAKLQKKLHSSFKWEHYFEVSAKDFAVNDGKTQRVRISKACEIEVKRLTGDELQLKLIGHGKVVVDKKHQLDKEDSVVLGGPDKNNSAWFVVLQFK